MKRYVQTLNVTVVETNLSMCTSVGADLIKDRIEKFGLNRIIIAACTPKTHEPVFQRVIQELALNRGYLEFVNLREHDSFVHMENKAEALKQAKDLVRAAIKRAESSEEVNIQRVKVNPASLVIGGGIAGLSAALDLANEGFTVY
ncbi:MAG: FAD-binding protein, partial [Candidatus Helarchaeota archaeon]|nr:FAD-binding protein [Candidatus Helarchaeota archaeon]